MIAVTFVSRPTLWSSRSVLRSVHCSTGKNANMAPKRTKEDEGGASKKAKTAADLPEVQPGWEIKKPSLVFFGTDLPPNSKIAAFDFDGTLVDWKEPGSFSLEPDSWQWFTDKVPAKLKEVHEAGHKIVIFSNQALVKSALTGKAATNAKAKFDSVLAAAGVPATVVFATQKDENRKPEIGMWSHFNDHLNGGTAVDKENSYYVGDAAGRKYDFSDSDKCFAEKIGLPFKTPEEVFGESARPNRDMAACLRQLAEEVIKNSDGDAKARFKANAFRKAANSIEAHTERITDAKAAMKLAGVGKGTKSLIEEFLESGEMGAKEREEREDAAAAGGAKEKAAPADEGKKAAEAKDNPNLAFL